MEVLHYDPWTTPQVSHAVTLDPQLAAQNLWGLYTAEDAQAPPLLTLIWHDLENSRYFESYLHGGFLGVLLNMAVDPHLYRFAWHSPVYGFSVSDIAVSFACNVLDCARVMIAKLYPFYPEYANQILPDVQPLCLNLYNIIFGSKFEGYSRDSVQQLDEPIMRLRAKVDGLLVSLFQLYQFTNFTIDAIPLEYLYSLVFRSWIRGHSEVEHNRLEVSLVRRFFDDGSIALRGAALPSEEDDVEPFFQNTFFRDLELAAADDLEAHGQFVIDLACTMITCVERYPKVGSSTCAEEMFLPALQNVVKAVQRDMNIDRDTKYTALKSLIKVIRILLQGVPFANSPVERARPEPLLEDGAFLFTVPRFMIEAAVKHDQDAFDDCRHILAIEAPTVLQEWKTNPGRENDFKKIPLTWNEIDTAISTRLQSVNKWYGKACDLWEAIREAYELEERDEGGMVQ